MRIRTRTRPSVADTPLEYFMNGTPDEHPTEQIPVLTEATPPPPARILAEPVVRIVSVPAIGGEVLLWIDDMFIDMPMEIRLEAIVPVVDFTPDGPYLNTVERAVVKSQMEVGHFRLAVDPVRKEWQNVLAPTTGLRERLAEVIGPKLVDDVLQVMFSYAQAAT